jgi:ligand-binding sensor domain-containing protein/signal transduction histidine kinase
MAGSFWGTSLLTRINVSLTLTVAAMIVAVGASKAPAERLPIRTYTTADGLPRDHINRIVQDSRGFLWFSTTEGLSRFDGYKFTNYGTEQGLAGRSVNDFLETRGGTYWAATDKGLCRFVPEPSPQTEQPGTSKRFVAFYPSENAHAQVINVIYEDHAGTIWCGTDAGLYRLDQINGRSVFSFADVIKPAGFETSPLVRAIIEDRQGALWIGAETGLYRLRADGIVERYLAEEGSPRPASVRALLEDRDGRIWVGTAYGVHQLVRDPKPHSSLVARSYTTKDGLSHNFITSLYESSSGNLWVGTVLGVCELLPQTIKGGGRFQNYTPANGLSHAQVTALAEDHDHNLWIGTDVGGAMRLAANGFTTYNQADGLGGITIGSIFEDQAGDLCTITGNGDLDRFDGRRFIAAPLTLPKGMSYWGWGWYQVMFQDSRGEWWMNTGEGLVRYPRLTRIEQLTHARPKAIYTTRDGLPDNEIFRLFEDSRGDIWISTIGKAHDVLTRWERATETFHCYTTADGIPEAAPTAFCEDASGDLWIGFYDGGLLRYSHDRFTSFKNEDGVRPGLVRGIYLDHAGRLWIATSEGGVARVDNPCDERPTFVTYSTADGLSSNQATCVTDDQWGMIYIGTGRGVDKLDPATGHIKHFTVSDGLANSFINVGFRYHDGSLWFGTLRGLSRLIPQPEQPTQPPPIFISALSIAGVPYPISELGASEIVGPELGANQNHIQIDFVGLSLGVGETLRYQFKLEGATVDWSAPTDQRSVNYPNLPPGAYRFFVRAVTAEGSLSQSPAMVSFRVLRPVWQRWWFVLTALILIAIPTIAVARYRHQQIKAVREAEEASRKSREERLIELEQVRRRIATDLHDDIGSSLSQVYLLSEVVRQRVGPDDSELTEPLAMISSASEEMVSSMSDIVWAINPQKDHLTDLILRMRRFASDTFATRDIAFQFRAPDAEMDVRLGANIRREVFLIFKESVNNLVKHSGCAEAEIEFQLTDSSLLLRVSDNGKGFDASSDSDGHGLVSMRERAASIGGLFDLVSEAGRGTIVTFSIKLAQPAVPSAPANTGGNGTG